MILFNDTYNEEIRKIAADNPKCYTKMLKSKGFKGRYPDRTYLIDYIYSVTPELNSQDFEYSLKTRIYWTINKIKSFDDSRVCCKCCGKPIKNFNVIKMSYPYKATCSKACERKLAQQTLEVNMMQKYGVKNPFQMQSVIEKNKQNKEEIDIKKKTTRELHFGDPNFNNSKQACQTKLDKYGSVWNISKIQDTKIQLHGNPNWNNPIKNFETKKKNGTCNQSLDELLAYYMLVDAFNDVKRQYKSDIYPFACDFYIPSIDTYVEYNGSWTHGEHAYVESNKEDFAKVEEWKSKSTKYYQNAINTWTIRDPNKRNVAKRNNANLKELWNLSLLYAWLNSIKPAIINETYVLPLIRILKSEKTFFDNYQFKSRIPLHNTHNYIIKYFLQDTFYKKEKELWKDLNIRQKLIENRCKYLSKIPEELTSLDLLDGFKKSGIHYGYSHFNPLLFKWFIQNYDAKSCYDPCGGWGHRLLGSNDLDLYIYNDLSKSTKDNVDKIIKFFKISNTVTYSNDARSFIPTEDFDTMFTCPPYFNLENYECESFKDENDFHEFIDCLFEVFNKKDACKTFGLVIREDMLFQHIDFAEKHAIGKEHSSYLADKDNNYQEFLYIFRK